MQRSGRLVSDLFGITYQTIRSNDSCASKEKSERKFFWQPRAKCLSICIYVADPRELTSDIESTLGQYNSCLFLGLYQDFAFIEIPTSKFQAMAILSNGMPINRRVPEPQDTGWNGHKVDEGPDIRDNVPGEQGRGFLNLGADGEVSTGEDSPPDDDSSEGSDGEADFLDTQDSLLSSASIITYLADGRRTTRMHYGSGDVISVTWPPDVDIQTVHSVEIGTVASILCGAAPLTAFESALESKGFVREGPSINRRSTAETIQSSA
jgi:hypothetical protein